MLEDDPTFVDEDVARLRLTLRHTNLSTLVEHGFLIWDHDENIVKKGSRFDAVTPLFDRSDDHGGELPDEYL
ncbi:hypothetical protein [Haladaptatus halobius]|uniref:hypothetical protein n=1 Tax=Haladaptatus halobius TaxID=2884875 RepID=UPI001D0AFA2C|nr:hypothetical protein [Haladaptatus halobius]